MLVLFSCGGGNPHLEPKPYGEYKMTTLTTANSPAHSAEEVKIYHAAFQQAPGQHVATWRPVTSNCELFDGLEAAYRCTNNLDGSWSREQWVEVDGEMRYNDDWAANLEVVGGRRRETGLRSTSCGDAAEVVSYNLKREEIERRYFVCATDGWVEVPSAVFDAYLEADSMAKCLIRDREQVIRIALGQAA
jgi:hypothetical protein